MSMQNIDMFPVNTAPSTAEVLGASTYDDVVKGFMHKQGGHTHLWHNVACELHGNNFWYGMSNYLPKKGPFKISGVAQSADDPRSLEIFLETGENMQLRANSDEDAEMWAKAFKAAKLQTAHEYHVDDLLVSSTAIPPSVPQQMAVDHVTTKFNKLEQQLGVTSTRVLQPIPPSSAAGSSTANEHDSVERGSSPTPTGLTSPSSSSQQIKDGVVPTPVTPLGATVSPLSPLTPLGRFRAAGFASMLGGAGSLGHAAATAAWNPYTI
eukprot:TRINITY_DN67625_c0_g1_i1.p1 TRINITY_DN67625_c0_g1~~TRINITY_DN67625_c0_g1_i1.p1  ORF type:complete len:276 (-),score=15.57 TRINITY_DN67625_c0_g1_i1:49-846(-)